MKRLLILLVLITCAAQAEIYKSKNDKGEWVYSDKPSPNAERMKLPPLSTYTAPPLPPPQSASAPGGGPAAVYETMVFVEPADDATIRDNAGVLKVMVGLDPPLKTQQGHKIQYYLDGSPYGDAIASPQLTVKEVERGTHELGAQVLSAGGELLLRAEPVTFHLQRVSVRVKPQPPKAR